MPPRKEIHFFDRSTRYRSPSHLASRTFFRRVFGWSSCNRSFRRLLRKEFSEALRKRDWQRVRWNFRYYFGSYDDRWYLSLFDNSEETSLRGEITPSYCLLDSGDVAHIKELFPALKVVFLLRNPIDRAWSQVRFNWSRGLFDTIDDLESVKRFVDSPVQDLRGNYVRTLDVWSAFFPSDQFFVGFYDEVAQAPRRLLSRIFRFLGVTDDIEVCGLRETVNASEKRAIPRTIELYLIEKYRPQIEELARRFDTYPKNWLDEASKTCARTTVRTLTDEPTAATESDVEPPPSDRHMNPR